MIWNFFHYTRPQLKGLAPLKHIKEQLVDGLIYFPRPSELNDPLDCHPTLERPTEAQIVAYLNRTGSARFPGRDRGPARRKGKQWARSRLSNKEWLRAHWKRSVSDYGVLSLSRSKCNHHLWKNYAQSHEGVCLEFSFEDAIDRELTMWMPDEVEYLDVLPSVNVTEYTRKDRDVIREFVRRSFRVKTTRWAIEEEVRVVYEVGDLNPPKVQIPPGMLRALYLGSRIEASHRDQIVSWASADVYQAVADERGSVRQFTRIV